MEIQSRNIKLMLILGFLIILGVFYFIKFSNQQDIVSSIHTDGKNNPIKQAVPTENEKTLAHTPIISIKSNHQSLMGDAASKAEIIDWFAKRGVYGFEGYKNPTEYDSYDEKTLRALGDSGDLRALHRLTDELQVPDYKELLEKAAIHGSTGAFQHMAIIRETNAVLFGKSDAEMKLAVKDALAYAEAAQLRGDWWVKIGYADSLPRMRSVILTEEDKLQIQKRGKEIYDDLQAKRTAMGLGDFDNSIPDSVMKFYDAMLQPLPKMRE